MSTTIANLPKNKKEELRISLDEFRGRQLFNVRVWFEAENRDMRPGKSGIAFRVDLLPDFAMAVDAAFVEARRQGLLQTQHEPLEKDIS